MTDEVKSTMKLSRRSFLFGVSAAAVAAAAAKFDTDSRKTDWCPEVVMYATAAGLTPEEHRHFLNCIDAFVADLEADEIKRKMGRMWVLHAPIERAALTPLVFNLS